MRMKFLILLFITNIIFAQNYQSVEKVIDKYKNSKLLKNASWSVTAKYLNTGETIVSLNSELALAPASNLKLLTTATALDVLGENHKFKTKIFYDGTIDANGNLNGNIYIVGGGDPTLGYTLVKGSSSSLQLLNKWTKAFLDKGIKSISGNIIADDMLYDRIPIPNNWYWIDLGNYFAASASALIINNNLYYLYFKPGKKVGDIAEVLRTEPTIYGLKFINFMKTGKKGSGDNGYIFNAPLQYNATLRGTIPKGKKEFSIKGSIPNPPLFVAQWLKKKLEASGVKVFGKAKVIETKKEYDLQKIITMTVSPPLKDIIFIVNKKSDNLYTEMLLRAIGLKKYREGSVDKGIEAVENYFEENKINHNGLLMYDGCGLSRSNAVTTNIMVDLLSMISRKKYFKTFYNSLAVVGDKKDISSYRNYGIGTSLEKNAHIKSGVIEGVRAYSGYLKDRKGRTIIFSMIANNFNGSGSSVANIHKKIMIKLAEIK